MALLRLLLAPGAQHPGTQTQPGLRFPCPLFPGPPALGSRRSGCVPCTLPAALLGRRSVALAFREVPPGQGAVLRTLFQQAEVGP